LAHRGRGQAAPLPLSVDAPPPPAARPYPLRAPAPRAPRAQGAASAPRGNFFAVVLLAARQNHTCYIQRGRSARVPSP